MANVPISAFTVPANTVGIGATGYSLTGSADASFMDIAGTWNTTGTPSAIKLNITDTASNGSSLLVQLQVGGVNRFRVDKNGNVTVSNVLVTGNDVVCSGTLRSQGTGRLDLGLATISGGGVGRVRLGQVDLAAPVAQTLSVQSVVAGTTNTAGANLTITGSQGTGTGAGGSIVFQVAPAGGSGTAQNALVSAMVIDSAKTVRVGTGYTVATLPTAGVAGRRTYVTDATAPTFLGALVGGGSTVCPVFDDGTAWVSA